MTTENKNIPAVTPKYEPETLRESSEPIHTLSELGASRARMEASVAVTNKASEIASFVTDPEESNKVFDAIIALSDSIINSQTTPNKRTQED